jgi:glutamate formiminotransferase
VAAAAVDALELRTHVGVHPRLGVVDVVPFVPLNGGPLDEAIGARDDFARWAAGELGVPCFIYGPERSLPEVRQRAWTDLIPDHGPSTPHPTAGAMCVGARRELVAYNVVLRDPDLPLARRIASAVRSPHLRALGLAVGDDVQVSMNLVEPGIVGPAQAYDLVARHAPIERTELVGLVPAHVLTATSRRRWTELDLGVERTIEWRSDRRNGWRW